MSEAPDDHPNTTRIRDVAHAAGVEVAVVRFPQGTRTAQDAATAIGCEVAAIAKSIVLISEAGPVVVLTSGANRVDYAKVAALLGAGDVRRATADEAKEATGFPIGGTGPWGHPREVPVLCDEALLAFTTVWAAAGTPDTVFSIAPAELVAISRARVADIAETP